MNKKEDRGVERGLAKAQGTDYQKKVNGASLYTVDFLYLIICFNLGADPLQKKVMKWSLFFDLKL